MDLKDTTTIIQALTCLVSSLQLLQLQVRLYISENIPGKSNSSIEQLLKPGQRVSLVQPTKSMILPSNACYSSVQEPRLGPVQSVFTAANLITEDHLTSLLLQQKNQRQDAEESGTSVLGIWRTKEGRRSCRQLTVQLLLEKSLEIYHG